MRAILGLNRTDSTWTIDPRSKMERYSKKEMAPTGVGNQVSVEFNLLYRWHSIISKRDAQWTAGEMRHLLNGKDPETATFHEMIMAFQEWERALSEDPHQRASVPNLSRCSDGAYDDDELVEILRGGIEDEAGSFGAKSVPGCMRPVEMLGILQARRWRVGTLNEFRDFIGLTRHQTFEDINPDPAVAAGLKALYGIPANVELYPGLVSEKTKPPMAPGSGVCVGYTSSRAILSDAVALVRGDRFYTDDFTPQNLTNWGFTEVDSDFDVDSGNVMYKLIFCAFPHHFKADSIYAHHPLVTPEENRIIFKGLSKASHYSWDAPSSREEVSARKEVEVSRNGTGNKEGLSTLAPSAPATNQPEIANFMVSTSRNLIKSKAHGMTGSHPRQGTHIIDVVGDVINLSFVRLAAEMFSVSLKTANDKRRGAYTDVQLSTILSVLHAANSPRFNPGRSYELKRQARDLISRFKKAVPLPGSSSVPFTSSKSPIRRFGLDMIRSQQSIHKEELADRVAALLASSAMVPVLLLSESLDYHLSQGPEHMEHLGELARQGRQTGRDSLTQQ